MRFVNGDRSFEQQTIAHRSIVQSGFAVHFLGQYRWACARVECRQRIQIVCAEWRSPGTDTMCSIQSEVYDACLGMHEHGLLATDDE